MIAESPVIAVVDDEDAVRRSTRRLLRAAGYGVTTFAGGAEFVEAFQSARPACVLLDLEMPGMNGLEVLSSLARQPVRVPVIIVTGRDTQESRRLAAGFDVAAYLEKPADASTLLAAIGAAIH